MPERFAHPLPFGAALDGETTSFRVWAPSAGALTLELGDSSQAMTAEPEGWFSAVADAPAGTRYRFKTQDGMAFPDPASRAQAGDVHDPSLVVDPGSYAWQHAGWRGRPWHEAVIYELHPGAFGGFDGIREQLPRLQALGITAVELMPIADFPGAHNWGYDGVLPLRPRCGIRHARPAEGDGGRRARPGPDGHAGRRLQPFRAGWRPTSTPSPNHSSGTTSRPPGARPSTSGGPRCGSISSRTHCTGCWNTGSTACGSTRCTRSASPASSTRWPP